MIVASLNDEGFFQLEGDDGTVLATSPLRATDYASTSFLVVAYEGGVRIVIEPDGIVVLEWNAPNVEIL